MVYTIFYVCELIKRKSVVAVQLSNGDIKEGKFIGTNFPYVDFLDHEQGNTYFRYDQITDITILNSLLI